MCSRNVACEMEKSAAVYNIKFLDKASNRSEVYDLYVRIYS